MQQVTSAPNGTISADWLAAKATELGFDLCGLIPAAELTAPEHFGEWLESGFAGEMRYLHDPRRADPAAVLPDARSVIVCAVNYNAPEPYSTEAAAQAAFDLWTDQVPAPRGGAKATPPQAAQRPQPLQAALKAPAARGGAKGWISRYAWGDDYHLVVGEKLEMLVAALRQHFGDSFVARAYVDTGPVSERIAAKLAGFGWLGKNTCLINRELGSWLFLGVILTSLDLFASEAALRSPAPDLCGNCRLCLDACPTGALVEPYVLDARRCISYLTIELRGSIPEEFRAPMGWQVFGCDICQDVCPWNRGAPSATLPGLAPRLENSPAQTKESGKARLEAPELLWLLSLPEEEFRLTFRHSAVRRAKWRGLIRNACVAAGNALHQAGPFKEPIKEIDRAEKSGERDGSHSRALLIARLEHWAASSDALIAEHARWALAQAPVVPRD